MARIEKKRKKYSQEPFSKQLNKKQLKVNTDTV